MENSELKEIFRRAMDAKALSHLNTARKFIRHEVNTEQERGIIDVESYIENQIAISLTKNVMSDVKNQIRITKGHTGNKVYELDLIVLPTEMFQYAINTIIKNMSQENLDKIRKQ
jgi:RNA binding exosome subunit